ncbi:tRNA-splicing endonuclease subunit [Conoideocrella luteorostrata]|uniref:tRNA-splicing endonuclease subunit Sen34 n=1 Tax=Conoideocrella luteorostrata TaxID=1105319 RepID=A0AAJ0CUW6_9HYPO|nr:tRNA-splicing endonuclease subunit [Conoideocrella luteorostrata]
MVIGQMAISADVLDRDFDLIRISKVAGRYLVFDPDSVARLRRDENTNGTLVGTTPQQPTQNIFLGLPVELRPEETFALLHKQVAYVVDDAAAHAVALSSTHADVRTHYIESLRKSKHEAEHALSERSASRRLEMAARRGRGKHTGSESCCSRGMGHIAVSSEFGTDQFNGQSNPRRSLAVTPVSSTMLLPKRVGTSIFLNSLTSGALCQFLQHNGNYMTPGLRFGAQYSVYPGDPLRFHAHFMANEYCWDEQIPILDIVGGGRLATAVKKAFLIGGLQTNHERSGTSLIRTYSIEWAAM